MVILVFRQQDNYILPYYYAKIEKCNLSERKLEVAVSSKKSKLDEFTLKYNCPTINGNYVGGTFTLKEPSITIDLKDSARTANVWLHHKEGFTVDFRSQVRRILDPEEIEYYIANPATTYYPEPIFDLSVAQAIRSYSDDFKRNFGFSTEECIDTIDQEILKSIKTYGNNYKEFPLAILKWLPSNDFLRHLGKLCALNHLYITDENRIALTAEGIGVTLMPRSSLIPRVPQDVAIRIAEIRAAFFNENFDKVINDTNILFEHILRTTLEGKFGDDLEKKWNSLSNMKPWGRATLGDLKTACVKFGIFSEKSLEAKLLEAFSLLRVSIAHKRARNLDQVSSAKNVISLVEIFVRYWFYRTD